LVFDKNCAQCHAFRSHGNAVGPNLGEFAGKSVADFVTAILDPNAAINPNYVAYNVETKDGRSLSGVVRGETASGLTLVQGGGAQETILRSDLQEIRASQLSLMPEGLEQAMSPQDVADLIAWIKSAGPASFGSASSAQAGKAREQFFAAGVNGVSKIVAAGGQLPYASWIGRWPMGFCRQDEGMNRVTWQTAPVPKNLGQDTNWTFRLPIGMGFLSQPSGKFTLRLNGQPKIDFDVSLTDRSWQSADGQVRMTYTVMEANSEDSNGVLVIETASKLLKPGEPATWEVIGSGARSQRWFGIYLAAGQP
jgi:putative heme-binding domain-containing protein